MKKLLLIIFLFTGFVNAQIVNIPDANFKAKLLSASSSMNIASNVNPNNSLTPNIYNSVDTNGDGEIQISEAEAIVFLSIKPFSSSNPTISNLEGIQYFTNLKYFNCSNNALTTINLASNVGLLELNCSNNLLTSLNVTNNTELSTLNCSTNFLTSINIDSCPNLKYYYCGANPIVSLSFPNNPLIMILSVGSSSLISLEIDNLQDLWIFGAKNTSLTSINISNKLLLTTVQLGYNPLLTNVVLNNLPHAYKINVQNCNISSLDLSTVAYMTYINNIPSASVFDISLNNNPNLSHVNLKNGFTNSETSIITANSNGLPQYICIDPDDVFIDTSYNNNTLESSYCNFTPGGNYNTITGSMIFDVNSNGCDASDLPQPNIKININDGTQQGSTFTSATGNYNFYTQAGSFVVTPAVENPSWFNFSPTTATIPFANNNNNTITQNFCISANGIHPDLEIVVSPIVPARPGFDAVYQIVYRNKGNQTLSQLYGINFFYNENLMDFVSASTATSSANSGSLSWDFANLQPFESRSIIVTVNINEPTDATYPVNIDDELQFTTSILPMAGDETTSDNTFVLHQTVVGAYDPNDIACLEGDSVAPSQIGNYLHYIINFENTGNYQAENIVVQDVIDATKFDISSLQIMNSSDPVYAKLTGNVAEFIFENIDLDSGGHGNILLKVRTKSSLQNGDFVNKNANIYFDYNAPITTNIANTIFQALGVTENNLDNSIVIYPNPAASVINVKCSFDIKSIQLYDIQGRILQTKLTNEMNAVIDISDKSNGVYFLKVVSDKGIKVEKIIKE